MGTLPDNSIALAALVFVLGARHGFDADHLAAIDGLTRYNARANPALARACGALFSLGHGSVVVAIALAVSACAGSWQLPAWLDAFGAWVSIVFLLALGAINLAAVLRAQPGEIVRPLGIRGRLFARLQNTGNPLLIAAVGMLFAFSFDTLSQAALFALSATQFGGTMCALALALLFMLGMLLADGINGLWISHLLRRADAVAQIASRVMGLVVAGVSLLVAGFGIARFFSPTIELWSEGRELACGLMLVAIIAASYVFARHLTRKPALAGA